MTDHHPVAHAFDELATMVFLEFLEHVAQCSELLQRSNEYELFELDDADDESDPPGEERTLHRRALDLACASCFHFKNKVEAWKLFCGRLSVPEFLLWEHLPGYERFQRLLAVTDVLAFSPEEMKEWLNRIRPSEKPLVEAILPTADDDAEKMHEFFEERCRFWGGTDHNQTNPHPSRMSPR
jgi:hypothetical protein